MTSRNLFSLWLGERAFTIRLYAEGKQWGWRKMDFKPGDRERPIWQGSRFAFDLGRISFLFENYKRE